MIAIMDSTVLLHLNKHFSLVNKIIVEKGITELITTRINYLETLACVSLNYKFEIKKQIQKFRILEFDLNSLQVANKLATKYRVGKTNKIDFLIASIAIANKLPLLTENDKDFPYKEIELLPYRIKNSEKFEVRGKK